jgi:L-serine dehydratase
MSISVLDLFTIGIGPSSSHTVGPMRAANRFVTSLADSGLLIRTAAVRAELFGSLGATGHGHGSPKAIMLGLLDYPPEHVDPDRADDIATRVGQTGRLLLGGAHDIGFRPGRRHLPAPSQDAARAPQRHGVPRPGHKRQRPRGEDLLLRWRRFRRRPHQ